MNVNSNEPLFYPYSIFVNKCSGSCNDINDPYAQLRVPDVAKDMNIKVFNLMSRTNETRRCRLDEVFLMIINVGIVIYAGVNAKSCLIKVIAIVNLFGILAYVSANLISRVMLENI